MLCENEKCKREAVYEMEMGIDVYHVNRVLNEHNREMRIPANEYPYLKVARKVCELCADKIYFGDKLKIER
jgi:hypothetical protein